MTFLPFKRYKDTGLRKRQDWEHVWDLKRKGNAIDAEVRGQKSEAGEDTITTLIKNRQKEEAGDIPVPPKYSSGNFKNSHWWKLRGKLDVPKERWIIYPGAERDGDPSPVIAWASWDLLQKPKRWPVTTWKQAHNTAGRPKNCNRFWSTLPICCRGSSNGTTNSTPKTTPASAITSPASSTKKRGNRGRR